MIAGRVARLAPVLLGVALFTSSATAAAADPPAPSDPAWPGPPPAPWPSPAREGEVSLPAAGWWTARVEPPSARPPPPPREPKSIPMMAAGISMIGVGVASVIAGSVLLVTATDRIDIYCEGPVLCAHKDDASRKSAGAAFMIVGGALSLGGVPLWILGAKSVLVKPKDDSQPAEEKKAASVELRAGLTSLSVAGHF